MDPKTRKFLIILISVPVALLLLIVLFLVEERLRGKRNLSDFRKALVARGEKVTPADLATQIGPELNGAPLLAEAALRLQASETSPPQPFYMRLLESGHAVAGFRQKEWQEGDATCSWKTVSEALERDAKALELARQALDLPAFDNNLDYSAGAKLLLPHLQQGRRLAQIFGASAQLALHNGLTPVAANDLVSQVRLIRYFENDRLLISELVRMAIAAVARSHTWESLQAENWADQDLARLAAAWQEVDFIAPMARAMEGERVYVASTYNIMRDSNEETVSALYWMEESGAAFGLLDGESAGWWNGEGPLQSALKFLRNQAYIRVWRFAWLDQNQAKYEQQIQHLAELLRETARHQSYQLAKPEIELCNVRFEARNLYDRLRMPGQNWLWSVSGGIPRCMRAQTERSMVLAAIALKRHHLRTGRYPDSLQALVPDYLERVPVDCMDGKPLRYLLKSDGSFLLYSIGEDLEDSFGDVSQNPDKPGVSNIWNRKDVVWPAEGTD